jgi:hypothetical protein
MLHVNGTKVWWDGPGELRVVPGSKRAHTRTGPSSGRLELTGKVIDERFQCRFTLALWKIGLEFVYLDRGAEVAFDPKFDPAREAVIGQRESTGWCIAPKEIKPHDNVTVALHLDGVADGRERAVVMVDVFGVSFASDLLVLDRTEEDIKLGLTFPANIWTFGHGKTPQHPGS